MTNYNLKTTGIIRGVYFSLGIKPSSDPDLSCSKAICDLFNEAQDSALISIFSLSNKDIINAMIDAFRRGVNVVVVADYRQSAGKTMNQYIRKLQAAGIQVYIASRQKACMHNKVGIFDGKIVATGSYNWTANASKRNDENLIVIEGTQIADQYKEYVFDRVIENETLKMQFKR